MNRVGIKLKHSIGSDGQLFEALVQELERRNVNFEQEAIVLVGEWDTFYGRALPMEFRAALCHRIKKDLKENIKSKYSYIKDEKQKKITAECPELEAAIELQINEPKKYEDLGLNVWRYSYIRGLDGQLPGEKQDKSPSKQERDNGESKKDHLLDVKFLEQPVGPSQLDYTRRLADRIELEVAKNHKVRAVGILGTDSYDALLILQALRDRFPSAIFFLTDLDARLAYHDDYRWTRNLVIASHFGLTLHSALQRDVPPFRSSYQTSGFFATLQAVGHVRALDVCPALKIEKKPCGYEADLTNKKFDATVSPRLYEVGRHGAVDLSVGKPASGYESLHPSRPDLEEKTRNGLKPDPIQLGAVLFLCSVAAVTGLLSYQGTRQWINKSSVKWVLIAPSLLIVFYILGVEWALGDHDAGEPFYWFEGVSIWPTEVLRVFVGLLVACFLVKGYLDLKINEKVIESKDEFTEHSEFGKKNWWGRFKITWLWVWNVSDRKPEGNVAVSWDHHKEAATLGCCIPRIFIYLVMLSILFVTVFMAIGLADVRVPCRGTFSCTADRIILFPLLVLANILNLFVLDAAMLTRRWIKDMEFAEKGWPATMTMQTQQLEKVRLVAQRTEAINRLARYPPLIWLLIIVARNNYFDQWNIPLMLIAVWSINLVIAVTPALLLYHAAEGIRSHVMEQLNRELHKELLWGKSADRYVPRTREAIKNVEDMKKGAFLPLWQQPVVEMFLYGVVGLLQYFYIGMYQ